MTSKLRIARDKFYGQTLTPFLEESPQKFWRFLSDSKGSLKQLRINGSITFNLRIIANEVNISFHRAFIKPKSLTIQNTNYVTSPKRGSMPDMVLSREGMFSPLLNIKAKKSSGADDIPNAFLRLYSEIISEYLYVLFSASLNYSRLPKDWLTDPWSLYLKQVTNLTLVITDPYPY